MDKLLIYEDLNFDFIKKNYNNEYKHIELDDNSILTGNIIFNIFDFDLKIDPEDYEIYSINNNKENIHNIYEIMISTNNKLCIYQDKLYCLKDFEEIINIFKNNKYSREYYLFILKNNLKKNSNIFDSIDLLDMNEFQKKYKSQYNIIKYFNNKPYLPINYCYNKLDNCSNKILREILLNMTTILKTLKYEIHPKFFDLDNTINYDYNNNDIKNLYQLMENCINTENYFILLRIITIFKLHIDNSEFIFFLLKYEHCVDKILKLIIDKNIYKTKELLEFLLILNKVNIFNSIYNENDHKINFNELIIYFIKYNSIVSFYYVLEKYFQKIQIKNIMSNDFLKIYLSFIKNKDNYNKYLLEYFKIIVDKNNIQSVIILNEINKNNLDENILDDFLNLISNSKNYKYIKYIVDTKNKKILFTNYILFKILDNKEEELFYYIINLFEEEEKNDLFNKLKDNENNTLYHYICKNSVCVGFKINNKIRNNKGFKPLDLCTISHKYYKI